MRITVTAIVSVSTASAGLAGKCGTYRGYSCRFSSQKLKGLVVKCWDLVGEADGNGLEH